MVSFSENSRNVIAKSDSNNKISKPFLLNLFEASHVIIEAPTVNINQNKYFSKCKKESWNIINKNHNPQKISIFNNIYLWMFIIK